MGVERSHLSSYTGEQLMLAQLATWPACQPTVEQRQKCQAGTELTGLDNHSLLIAASRAGMVACTACSGGSYPNPKRTGCIQCAPGTFRAYSNAS